MRTFDTGATRDTLEGKLSYKRALSPAVLQRYVQYLAKHRKQADGNLRDFDNWKHGIPQDDYLDSLLRHVWDMWLFHNGKKIDESVTPEDLLCAIIFNASGYLFELLVAKGDATRELHAKPTSVEVRKTCGECANIDCWAHNLMPDSRADPNCIVLKDSAYSTREICTEPTPVEVRKTCGDCANIDCWAHDEIPGSSIDPECFELKEST